MLENVLMHNISPLGCQNTRVGYPEYTPALLCECFASEKELVGV